MGIHHLLVGLMLAATVSGQSQWRRFAPVHDFEPLGGAIAADPFTGDGRYIGTTATSGGLVENWRHVDGVWVRAQTANVPPVVSGTWIAASCPGHGILLAGLGQLWRYDGNDWMQVAASGVPGFSAMEWDPVRQRLVAWRSVGSNFLTYEWDGATWQSFSQASGSINHGRLAWHGLLQRVVMLGRNSSAQAYFSWTGSSWVNHSWALNGAFGFSFSPAPNGKTIACGGWDFTYYWGGSRLWDGASEQSLDALPNAPAWRTYSLSWFDPVRQRTVVTGMFDNWTTWTWDGTQWSVSPAGPLPPSADPLVYDSWRGEVLMVGGWSSPSNEHSDLWARRDAAWVRLGTGPFAPRRYANVAFDTWRGRLVMFGGATHDSGAGAYYTFLPPETFEWDGSSWSLRTPPNPPVGTHPRSSMGAAIAFDRQRGKTVVFGGYLNFGSGWSTTLAETWEWDGVAWLQRSPSTIPPGDRYASMAFDGANGRCALRSGSSLWSWDGTDWSPANLPALPLNSQYAQLVEDPIHQTLVLLHANATFAVQGNSWVQVANRRGSNATFDLRRGAIVGIDSFGSFEFGDPAAATITPIGGGCAGSQGVALLHGEGPPRLGTTLTLHVERVPTPFAALGMLGADVGSYAGLPLPIDLGPLGLPQCSLVTAIDAVQGLLSPTWSFPIPASTTLLGAAFTVQAIVSDPGANPAAFVTSHGMRLRIGA